MSEQANLKRSPNSASLLLLPFLRNRRDKEELEDEDDDAPSSRSPNEEDDEDAEAEVDNNHPSRKNVEQPCERLRREGPCGRCSWLLPPNPLLNSIRLDRTLLRRRRGKRR